MDFHQRIRALDHQPVGEGLCAIPTGRAYRNGNSLYADKIHVFPYGESLKTLQAAPLYPAKSSGLYMGVAGLINMGNIRALKPAYAVLFDVNPYQTIFWNIVLFAAKQNETYEGFRNTLNYSEVIGRNIIGQKLGNLDLSSGESMTYVLDNGGASSLSRKTFPRCSQQFSSYLDEIKFSNEDYASFRAMAVQGKIGTLTLDVFDQAGWQQFTKEIESLRMFDMRLPQSVDSLYVSSVFRFAKADTDWTGRKLKEISTNGIFSVLDPQKSVVMDSLGVYSVPEFQTSLQNGLVKGELSWPSHRLPMQKESAQGRGAVQSVPPSSLSLTA